MRNSKKEDLLPKSLFDYVQVKIALPKEKQVVSREPRHTKGGDHDFPSRMELDSSQGTDAKVTPTQAEIRRKNKQEKPLKPGV